MGVRRMGTVEVNGLALSFSTRFYWADSAVGCDELHSQGKGQHRRGPIDYESVYGPYFQQASERDGPVSC